MSPRELQPREKWILVGGGIVFIIFIAVYFLPGGSPKAPKGGTKAAERAKEAFSSELQEYQALQGTVGKIDDLLNRTPPDYDLYGALTQILEAANLRSQTRKMNREQGSGTDYYSESFVDLDLQEIHLEDLVDLMKKVEELPAFVRVSQLSVKRRYQGGSPGAGGPPPAEGKAQEENSALDVSLRIAVYSKGAPKTPGAPP